MSDVEGKGTGTGTGYFPPSTVSTGPSAARRISVVGATGSGKTYLARVLAISSGIPLYELDKLRNAPDGTRRTEDEFLAAIAEIIARDEWIIDGHYRSVRHLIWGRSDQIVWLDFSVRTILRRLLGRYLRKKARRDVPANISGSVKLPGESASWPDRLRRWGRALEERQEYATLLCNDGYADAAILKLDDPAKAQEFIQALKTQSGNFTAGQSASRQRRVPIVELFGLPGSGKTTLTDVLAQELAVTTREGVSARWAAQSLFCKAYYIFRGLTDFRAVRAAIVIAIKTRLTSRESLFRLVRMLSKGKWHRSQPGALLMDQGFLQDIWSVLYGARAKGDVHASIAQFIAAIYRGTQPTILYLDLGPNAAASRIASRSSGSSRLDRLQVDEVRERLSAANWIPEQILMAAVEGGLRVKTLNANDTPENVAKAAMALLAHDGWKISGAAGSGERSGPLSG